SSKFVPTSWTLLFVAGAGPGDFGHYPFLKWPNGKFRKTTTMVRERSLLQPLITEDKLSCQAAKRLSDYGCHRYDSLPRSVPQLRGRFPNLKTVRFTLLVRSLDPGSMERL